MPSTYLATSIIATILTRNQYLMQQEEVTHISPSQPRYPHVFLTHIQHYLSLHFRTFEFCTAELLYPSLTIRFPSFPIAMEREQQNLKKYSKTKEDSPSCQANVYEPLKDRQARFEACIHLDQINRHHRCDATHIHIPVQHTNSSRQLITVA
jgi:hypothetical protein